MVIERLFEHVILYCVRYFRAVQYRYILLPHVCVRVKFTRVDNDSSWMTHTVEFGKLSGVILVVKRDAIFDELISFRDL